MRNNKEKFNIWLRSKLEKIVLRIVKKLNPVLKENITDPYMVFILIYI